MCFRLRLSSFLLIGLSYNVRPSQFPGTSVSGDSSLLAFEELRTANPSIDYQAGIHSPKREDLVLKAEKDDGGRDGGNKNDQNENNEDKNDQNENNEDKNDKNGNENNQDKNGNENNQDKNDDNANENNKDKNDRHAEKDMTNQDHEEGTQQTSEEEQDSAVDESSTGTQNEGNNKADESAADKDDSDKNAGSDSDSRNRLRPDSTDTPATDDSSKSNTVLTNLALGFLIGGGVLIVGSMLMYRRSSVCRLKVSGMKETLSTFKDFICCRETSSPKQRKPRYPNMKTGPRTTYPAGLVNESDYSDSDTESPSRPPAPDRILDHPVPEAGAGQLQDQDAALDRSRSASKGGDNRNHTFRVGRAYEGYVSLRDEAPHHIAGDSSPPGMRDFRSLKAWM